MLKTDVKIKRLFAIHPWEITETQLPEDGFDFRLSESITSLGNEYMGMRGNFEETYTGDTHQGTYIGGIWYPDKTVVGWWKNGYPRYFGKVVNAVDYFGLKILVNGEELDLFRQKPSKYQRTLKMREGVLERMFEVEVGGVVLEVKTQRFISLAMKELGAMNYWIKPHTPATIEISSFVNGDVKNRDANFKENFWQHLTSKADENSQTIIKKMKANDYGIERFGIGVKAINHFNLQPTQISFDQKDLFAQTISQFHLQPNQELNLEKIVVVTNTLNYPEAELLDQTNRLSDLVKMKTYQELKNEHLQKWEQRWNQSDVLIEGSDVDQQAIRFNLFQLFSTYYGRDERLNIGPKGFTGEKYGGATYWDTEAYCVPFYLKTAPAKVTKSLLKYRHQQLEKAKENAQLLGLKGALYPMVTFNGVECHNEWEITFEEIHRNAAIVYAIANYVNYTNDFSYIKDFGMDVMSEVCRFWASRVHYVKEKQQYMIHGVTGPNEYENNVNNNWLTNLMGQWTLTYTLSMLDYLGLDPQKWGISQEERSNWEDIIQKMYLPVNEKRGIFVQHDGFLDKDLKTKDDLSQDERPINKNWSWDKILRSPYIKQADVLQGIYYLWGSFSKAEIQKNFEFYEPFTVHESSLSPCIHGIISAKLGLMDKAYEFYARTARLDLDNYNNDTDDGLHITSMTGSYLVMTEGFGGMDVNSRGMLCFAPSLPSQWTKYQFHINFHGRIIQLTRDQKLVKVSLLEGQPLILKIFNKKYQLEKELQLEV